MILLSFTAWKNDLHSVSCCIIHGANAPVVRQGSNDFSVAPYQCVRVSSSMCNIKEMHFYFGVFLELFAAVAEISKCSFYNGKN